MVKEFSFSIFSVAAKHNTQTNTTSSYPFSKHFQYFFLEKNGIRKEKLEENELREI